MAIRKTPEVNAGSMADVAFLLLIFFLVTTTMKTNVGIATKLPPKIDKNVTPPPPVNKRNLMVVLVNKNNQLMVRDQIVDIKDLRQVAIDFLDNGAGVADQACSYCKGRKDATSSENPNNAVISLQNDRETSYSTYIAVSNELTAAYNVLRERERQRLFPNEVPYTEMEAEYDAASTSLSRKNELEPKIKEIQKLFPKKLVEAKVRKD